MRRTSCSLVLLLLVAGTGCEHTRTHDPAPGAKAPLELAAHVAERLAPIDLRTDRTVDVMVLYREPAMDPIQTFEQLGVSLIPLFPYARGEWPVPEVQRLLEPVLERLLAPHFGHRDPDAPADYLLELQFTEDTHRRITYTSYGLPIWFWGGVSALLGYPTNYATVALEADMRLFDRAQGAGSPPVFKRRVRGVETALSGMALYFIVYNPTGKTAFIDQAGVVTWDDLLAEALVDFTADLRAALGEALAPAGSAAERR